MFYKIEKIHNKIYNDAEPYSTEEAPEYVNIVFLVVIKYSNFPMISALHICNVCDFAEKIYKQSVNMTLSLITFGKALSNALCSIAKLPFMINTDSSLDIAVLIHTTLWKSMFIRSIQFVT